MVNNWWVYDTEEFPNVFTCAFEHAEAPIRLMFEISEWRNDSDDLLRFLWYLRNSGANLVGFNNVGWDYPILHQFIRMGKSDPVTLYNKAQAIINSQNNDDEKWAHSVKASDHFVPQVDLYLIHHFNNRARSTGLKVLEFNMRSDTIEDLPFAVGTNLNQNQVGILKQYNVHDVSQTKKFLHHSLPMIRFRQELTQKYGQDFVNYNDTKIGKSFFLLKLEEAGVSCYDYGPNGRTPRQTKRDSICLGDVILPWIKFEHPEFNRVLEQLKNTTIVETKDVLKGVKATVNGFTFHFGTGGIHGSVENRIIKSSDETIILDLDVSSYYPHLAIANKLYPKHLGETFCDIYQNLYNQRKRYAKGTAESAMLKLALNGVYGDSNNQYSPFYDPAYTMAITINGQLLLCLLAERLMTVPGLELIQINTDGVTVQFPQHLTTSLITNKWENETGLTLEKANYTMMAIRDVNSYLAITPFGKIKRKGAYEYKLDWHQNASALVVPKVAEEHLLEGAPIRETIETWPDKMDFMLRTKVPRSSHLTVYFEGRHRRVQNTSRYYVAEGGYLLTKHMPPLKNQTEWRQIGVEADWGVCVCNDIKDATMPVNYDYYIQEVEKLVGGLK